VGKHLSSHAWDQCFTSDLGRAQHTTRLLLGEHVDAGHLASLQTTPMLRERAAGAYEGLPRGARPATVALRTAHSVEGDAQMVARARAFLEQLGEHRGSLFLAVSHGGLIGSLLRHICQVSAHTVPNASISVLQLEVHSGGLRAVRVLSLGDTTHLGASVVARSEWTDAAPKDDKG
jgi:broad specificity phosphatase PhoE